MKNIKELTQIIISAFFLITLLANSGFSEEKKTIDINKAEYSTGTIDRLAEDEVVIDDCLYKYAKGFIFVSRKGSKIASTWFKTGEKIRFSLNSKNQVLIIRKL